MQGRKFSIIGCNWQLFVTCELSLDSHLKTEITFLYY